MEVRHVRYMQSGTINIAGYTQAIEQPFLVDGNGEHIRCKIGDSRLLLSDQQLKDMGEESSTISLAVQHCA
jgi:hypothetical protein